MKSRSARQTENVLSIPIDVVDWDSALARIHAWGEAQESRYVCISNVHSLVTATREVAFRNILVNADMATPDGAPVAWMLRSLGHRGQERINGPDLMWRYCGLAARKREAIYLLGSTPETLVQLKARLRAAFPQLIIAGAHSPPYRRMTVEEEEALICEINASGASTVWVSLGCPKQEAWMARNRGRVMAVMIGVGAAFDFHAGTVRRAPIWMQQAGLEWLHRLASDPRRLWRRYLVTNTLFVVYAIRQLAQKRRT